MKAVLQEKGAVVDGVYFCGKWLIGFPVFGSKSSGCSKRRDRATNRREPTSSGGKAGQARQATHCDLDPRHEAACL